MLCHAGTLRDDTPVYDVCPTTLYFLHKYFLAFIRDKRCRSLTMLTKFCPLLTTYLPPVDIDEEIPDIRENLHIVDISSTIYLSCLVNVVKERPLSWLNILCLPSVDENAVSHLVTTYLHTSIRNLWSIMRSRYLLCASFYLWSFACLDGSISKERSKKDQNLSL